jgi:hypothetical protein
VTTEERTISNVFVHPDRIASVRIVLGLEPYGPFPDDDGEEIIETAFHAILEDVCRKAIDKFIKSPSRARLLFDLAKTRRRLRDALADAEEFPRFTFDDVEQTRFRDRLNDLRNSWAQKEADVVRPLALTDLDRLLQTEYQLLQRLSKPKGRAA